MGLARKVAEAARWEPLRWACPDEATGTGSTLGSHLDDAADSVDAALVERYLGGDTTAFGELYARHYARLLRYVGRRLHEQYVAEDIAQESFIRALNSMADLRNRHRFYPWLAAIARHLVERHLRFASRTWVTSDPEAGATEPADAELLRRESHADVREALARIRPRYAQALQLREDEDLTYEQLAERLGLTATAIPALLFRARVAFRHEYLAVTRQYRRWFTLAPLFVMSALRRVRDRAAQIGGVVPDGSILMGAAVLSASISLGLPSLMPERPGPAAANSAGEPVTVSLDQRAGALQTHGGQSGFAAGHAVSSPTGPTLRSDVMEAGIQNRTGARRTRDRVHEWPIVLDQGPVGMGLNPEPLWEDVQSIGNGTTPTK